MFLIYHHFSILSSTPLLLALLLPPFCAFSRFFIPFPPSYSSIFALHGTNSFLVFLMLCPDVHPGWKYLIYTGQYRFVSVISFLHLWHFGLFIFSVRAFKCFLGAPIRFQTELADLSIIDGPSFTAPARFADQRRCYIHSYIEVILSVIVLFLYPVISVTECCFSYFNMQSSNLTCFCSVRKKLEGRRRQRSSSTVTTRIYYDNFTCRERGGEREKKGEKERGW